MGVVDCPACGQGYSVGPELAGKKIRCRRCGGGVRIPEATASGAGSGAPAPLKGAAPSAPKAATPPKPGVAPSPPEDVFDAYGLAEEPEDLAPPVVTEKISRPREKTGKGKKRKKGRGGIGGLVETAREKPVMAVVVGALLLGMLLFVVISPYAALPILLLLGVISVLLGGLATAILIFAQAPGMAMAMIVALIATIGAAAMLGDVGGGRASRPWPMGLAGAAWGALLLRGRRRDIRLDGDAFRIPKRMMGWGAGLAITMLVGMFVFAPSIQRPRFAPRPGGGPPGFASRGPLGAREIGPASPPELPVGRQLEPGVMLHEVSFGPPWMPGRPLGRSGKLWVYLPEGEAAPKSLPCVVIAGAGTPMILGMDLSMGDRPEHIPWVKAGFAVVAYDIDGASRIPLTDNMPIAIIRPSIEGFLKARAGVANTRNALDYIASKLPSVDPSRIMAVGHSSAATLALLAAQNDARFRGVVAFAPGQYNDDARIRGMERAVPGISELLTTFNPAAPANLERLSSPVFLFTAEDDGNVPAAKTRELASALQSRGKRVTLETTPSGGHYDAMINPGISKAIAWARRTLPAGIDP